MKPTRKTDGNIRLHIEEITIGPLYHAEVDDIIARLKEVDRSLGEQLHAIWFHVQMQSGVTVHVPPRFAFTLGEVISGTITKRTLERTRKEEEEAKRDRERWETASEIADHIYQEIG